MRVWVHKTSLAPPLFFIEVPVASQESEMSGIYIYKKKLYVCVLGNDFASSTIFLLDFGIKGTQGNLKMCGLYE